MAGSYCMFCGNRCFVLRVIPAGRREGWSGHLATCGKGKEYDRQQTDGYDADNTINPMAQPAPCPECHGSGQAGQQPDGLIVECPRGCMTRDEDNCTDCGRDVSRPGRCFDCDVEGSYVGGLAPRFGAEA